MVTISRSPVLLALVLLVACTGTPQAKKAPAAKAPSQDRVPALAAQMEKLLPLHDPMGPVRPGDWLETKDEPGQTFDEYLKFKPVTPRGKRSVLYIQPIGPFADEQRKIVDLCADFMGRYFGVPVKVLPDLPLSIIPKDAQREHPSWGMHQLLTGYILDEVLHPRLPDDAAACIGFTAIDLWPGEKVLVVCRDNGARLETYVQPGPAGSGAIIMNGAAVRRIGVGDRITLMAFAASEKPIVAKKLLCDAQNNVIRQTEGIDEVEPPPEILKL